MGKSTRRLGAALITAALALSLIVPAVSANGGAELEQNSVNVAVPVGVQDVGVSADASNSFDADQTLRQRMLNVQLGAAIVHNDAAMEDIGGEAKLIVKSGESDAYGHSLNIDLSGFTQRANASANGNANATSSTGNANTTVSGDVSSSGGDASARQTPISVIFALGRLAANDNTVGGNGGDEQGNIAGSGPSVSGVGGGGNGGFNIALALGRGGNAGSANGGADEDAGGNGGSTAGGNGAQVNGAQTSNGNEVIGPVTAGRGGDASGANNANGGAGTLTPTLSQLNGQPNSQAWGSAAGGSADSQALGHVVYGGNTGGNVTAASVAGGTALNGFSLGIQQSGNQTSSTGDAVNNGGSANAPVTAWIDQRSSAENCQDQRPQQNASNTANAGGQNATTGAITANPSQSVSSGQQNASNSANQNSNNTFTRTFTAHDIEVELGRTAD